MRIDYPRAGRSGLRRFLPSWRQLLGVVVLGVALVVAGFGAAYALVDVPQPKDQQLAQASVVYYRDGKTELGRFGDINRTAVPLDKVPQYVQDAVLAAEDRTFYTNRGISPTGIARALYRDVVGGGSQGGSTITQQYVKNVYLTQQKTVSRKLKEWIIAVKVDQSTSKDQILENYLNTIYWGRGAYGVQAAAQAYFGKDVSALTPAQGAFLAGIIQSPGNYDPTVGPKSTARAQARWAYVVDGMHKLGFADAAANGDKAQAEGFPQVQPRKQVDRLGGPKGYLLQMVEDELVAQGFDQATVETGGLQVTSTFDAKAQAAAERAVKDNFPTENAKDVHAGLTAVRPGTGEIVALYGGPDYVKAPGQNAALAQIQAGSTFKPFTLVAALENGISLSSRYAGNSPLQVPGGKPVRNEFSQDYGQSVDLRKAIEQSINTAFVDLTLDVGAKKVLDAAVQTGIPKDTPGLEPNAVITLGTASVNSAQMANAYATFAAQGRRVDGTHVVLQVKQGVNAKVVYKAAVKPEKAFDANIAANVDDALAGVVQRGTGTAARALGRPAAGKTGTAESNSAWFVGYTPQLSTAVEFYKGDGTVSLDGVGGQNAFFGGGYPAQTWTAFMQGALEGEPVQDFPAPQPIGQVRNPAPSTPTSTPTPTGPATPSTTPTPTPSASATDTGPATPTASASPTDNGNGGGGGGGGTPTATSTTSAAPTAVSTATSPGTVTQQARPRSTSTGSTGGSTPTTGTGP